MSQLRRSDKIPIRQVRLASHFKPDFLRAPKMSLGSRENDFVMSGVSKTTIETLPHVRTIHLYSLENIQVML